MNPARHASARHVQVTMAGSRTRVRLSISDDGRGLDVDRISAKAVAQGIGTKAVVADGNRS